MIRLSAVTAKDQGRFASQLAAYLAEVLPEARLDPVERAGQMIHRRDMQVWWLMTNSATVGFATVLDLPEGRRELSEFAILRPYRRQGLGRLAAEQVLATHHGHWRMGISARSASALGFWGTCLSLLPNVRDLREGAPFTQHQIKSFTFVTEAVEGETGHERDDLV